eukprot:5078614-Alexandrium_andersonii.AAC.1
MAEYHCSRVRPGITISSGSAPTKRTLSAVTWRGHQTRFLHAKKGGPDTSHRENNIRRRTNRTGYSFAKLR